MLFRSQNKLLPDINLHILAAKVYMANEQEKKELDNMQRQILLIEDIIRENHPMLSFKDEEIRFLATMNLSILLKNPEIFNETYCDNFSLEDMQIYYNKEIIKKSCIKTISNIFDFWKG